MPGLHHDFLGGRSTNENSHPQYLSKRTFFADLETFINVAQSPYNAKPGTGVSVALNIQNAFDNAPDGSTLYFPPGEYLCDASLLCSRRLNIYAYGAVFNFGTTNLAGTGYAFRYGNEEADVADRMERKSLLGLTAKRTYGTTVASLLYTGFSYHALLECTVQDVEAIGFEKGHEPHGGLVADIGNVHNNYNNLKTFDCRYGYWISDGAAVGYSNENNYFGGRLHLSSTITDEAAAPWPGNAHAIHIAFLGTHVPNNNRFYGVSMETAWPRKIYCEGIENYWYSCRYENQNGTCDIEFYDTAVAGQHGSRNLVFEGDELQDVILQPPGGNGSNFDGSGRTVNLNKVCDNQNWRIRGGDGTGTDAAIHVSTGTSTNDAIQVRGTNQVWSIGMQADDTTNYAGALTFRDPATGAILYKLRMRTNLTPDQFVITDAAGVDVGSFYLDSTTFVLRNLRANTADNGFVEVIGGKTFGAAGDELVPALQVRNSITSSHLAQIIATAGDALRIGFVAEEGGGRLGAIVGYSGAAGAEVERNRIHLSSASPYPWVVQHRLTVGEGAVINEDGLDSDTRIEGDTDVNAFYLDASAAGGSVGIGTATPASKLEIQGNVNIETTSVDAFLVEGPSGEYFRVDTDNDVINSGLPHRFEGIASIQGGFAMTRHTVASTPFTVLTEHAYLAVDTSTAKTLNLPALSGLDYSMVLIIKATLAGVNNVTVTPNGAETIEGLGGLTIIPGGSARLMGGVGTTDWEVW